MLKPVNITNPNIEPIKWFTAFCTKNQAYELYTEADMLKLICDGDTREFKSVKAPFVHTMIHCTC